MPPTGSSGNSGTGSETRPRGWTRRPPSRSSVPTQANLTRLLERKETVTRQVFYAEGIWDFYFDLFVQRLSAFGERLRGSGPDRGQLLRGPVPGPGHRASGAAPAAVQLRVGGLQPAHLPARGAAPAAAAPSQPLPPGHPAAAPPGQRLGAVERAARGFAQPAGRPGPVGGHAQADLRAADRARAGSRPTWRRSGPAGTRRSPRTCSRSCWAAPRRWSR